MLSGPKLGSLVLWNMKHIVSTNSSLVEMKDNKPAHLADSTVPLVGDPDGTLAKTDLLVESVVSLLKEQPWYLFALPAWLLRGKAAFKREIARRISFDPRIIPYRAEFIEYLKDQRANGRKVVLATASDEQIAMSVAGHLKLFDSVLASDGTTNLAGERKRASLVSRFGERGFDYAGNGTHDMAVWSSARKAIVVNNSREFAKAVGERTPVQELFEGRRG